MKTADPWGRHGARGITLIELVVAMLIVALLASIAIPSYSGYVRRVARLEAKVALNDAAQRLQRCYTRFNAYDNAACTLTGTPYLTERGKYQIDAPTLEGQRYSLTATPQGPQADDTDCGTFTLDSLGTQGVSGSTPAAECWQR